MTIKFQKVGIQNIESGKTVELINEYLGITAKDLFKMADIHHVDAKKLKGKVMICLTIQPLSDLEDHFSISSEVTRVLPKITNTSLAIKQDEGLFVQERGSDYDSPLQTTIENFEEEVEEEGEYIKDGKGNKISTKTGEVKKA
jgi:hypothetical protein